MASWWTSDTVIDQIQASQHLEKPVDTSYSHFFTKIASSYTQLGTNGVAARPAAATE